MALGVQFSLGHFQGLDNEGLVVPYGKLYFTDSFTGDPIYTYKDSSLTVVNTHPVILSATGKANIFLSASQYNIVLKDANDQVIWSVEDYVTVGLGVDLSAWREKIVATAAQTDFVFSNPVSTKTLVFVNGVLKEEGSTEDYIVVPPYTITFNTGLSLNDEVVGVGNAPTVTKSTLYGDGSVPMDAGYSPAVPLDIATKEYIDAINTALGLLITANTDNKVSKTSNQALGSAANVMTISNDVISLARGDGDNDSVTLPHASQTVYGTVKAYVSGSTLYITL